MHRSMLKPLAAGRAAVLFAILLLAAPPAEAQGRVEVENEAGAPFSDRLVFSRIGSLAAPPANGVHDRGSVRLRNTGPADLAITGLSVSGGPFEIEAPPSLPAVLAAGESVRVTIRFVAQMGNRNGRRRGIYQNVLVVSTDDPERPALSVELAGYWQSVSEGGREARLPELVNDVLGYPTVILDPGESINTRGRVEATGEEVLSPYWRRADESRPVTVRQLAAFHGCCTTEVPVYWHPKGQTTVSEVVRHAPPDGQSVLPRRADLSGPAAAAFTPVAGAFGFRVSDNEWSDPSLNDASPDDCSGGPETCGQRLRFWPVRDRSGALVPGQYLMAMDYDGINYDYNDNVYLIENLAPDGGMPGDVAWTPRARAQEARTEAPSAAIGGRLYVFGGFVNEALEATPSVERYDLASDTWEPRAPMPVAVTHAGTARVGDAVWLVGGFEGDSPGSSTDVVQIYDTAADAWSFGPPLPKARASGALVRFGSRLHYVGGLESRNDDVADHYVLDLGAPEAGWTEAAPLPDALNHHAGVALDGRIYAVGGQHRHNQTREFLQTLYAYDPASDTWERQADLPYPRSHTEPGTFAYRGRIYVVGGLADAPDAVPAVDHVTAYDPATNAWTAEPPLPATLIGPAARVLGEQLVISHGGLVQNYYPQDHAYSRPAPTDGADRLAFWPGRIELSVPAGGRGGPTAVVGTLGAEAAYSISLEGRPAWLEVSSGASGVTDASGRDVTIEASAVGLDVGTYTATLTAQAQGLTASLDVVLHVHESTGGGRAIGEAGVVTVTQADQSAWTSVSFERLFSAPVVVAGPPSYNGPEPTTIRTRNVTAAGFEVQVDEWDYLDGQHIAEAIGWLAVEAGRHRLPDNRAIEAGWVGAVDHTWRGVAFRVPFDAPPAVLVQVASAAGPAAVTPRVRRVTASGFEVVLQEEEGADGRHADEVLGWVAVEVGPAEAGGIGAGRTLDVVTNRPQAVPFGSPFSEPPVVVASLQTFSGTDPASLRATARSASAFSVFVEEEQSRDTETVHVTEVIGWAAARPGPVVGEAAVGTQLRHAPVAAPAAIRLGEPAPTALVVQNVYPNPSRGAARIRYGVPEGLGSRVAVEVFDAVGRRVSAVDAASQGAGWHEADLGALALPPGLYLVRIRAGGGAATRPFAIIR